MRKVSALAVGIATISLGLSACSGTGNEGSSPATVTTASASAPSSAATTTTSSSPTTRATTAEASSATVDLANHTFPVTPKDAMKHAVDAADGGFVHSLKIKHDNRFNAWLWEVKVLNGTTQHKVKINADTAEIVKHEQEQTNDTEKEINLDSPMSFADAKEKALEKRTGRIIEWKYEWDDNHYEYQFDINIDGSSEEVTVNADTGAVTAD